MKDWVKPFLIERTQDELETELGHKVKEGWRERYRMQLARDTAVYYELTRCLNTDFSSGGLTGPREAMVYAFGSVLANLPETVFKRLYETKNLFFSVASKPGAEVKLFFPDHDIKAGEKIQVVTFPFESRHMEHQALRGQIVDELIHLYQTQENKSSLDEVKKKTDDTAKSWGFEDEIRAFRGYWAKQERIE